MLQTRPRSLELTAAEKVFILEKQDFKSKFKTLKRKVLLCGGRKKGQLRVPELVLELDFVGRKLRVKYQAQGVSALLKGSKEQHAAREQRQVAFVREQVVALHQATFACGNDTTVQVAPRTHTLPNGFNQLVVQHMTEKP